MYRDYCSFCYSFCYSGAVCPAPLWAACPTLPQLPTLFRKAGQYYLLSPCLVVFFHFPAECVVITCCLNPGLWGLGLSVGRDEYGEWKRVPNSPNPKNPLSREKIKSCGVAVAGYLFTSSFVFKFTSCP